MKLLFISMAFLLFFVKNIIAIIFDILNYLVLIDMIIIIMLYLAAAKK
jgi:hypothetical protein